MLQGLLVACRGIPVPNLRMGHEHHGRTVLTFLAVRRSVVGLPSRATAYRSTFCPVPLVRYCGFQILYQSSSRTGGCSYMMHQTGYPSICRTCRRTIPTIATPPKLCEYHAEETCLMAVDTPAFMAIISCTLHSHGWPRSASHGSGQSSSTLRITSTSPPPPYRAEYGISSHQLAPSHDVQSGLSPEHPGTPGATQCTQRHQPMLYVRR